MGKTTISWCDYSHNFWLGCSKVKDSPACNHCYAWMMDVQRFSKTLGGGTKENPISHWGPGAPRYRTSESAWKAPYKWNQQAIGTCTNCAKDYSLKAASVERFFQPGDSVCLKCGQHLTIRKPRVFSLSLGDWLDEEVPIEWLADMLKVIHDCQNLTWLLLTKRPENWYPRLSLVNDYLSHAHYGDADYELRCWVNEWLYIHNIKAMGLGGDYRRVHIGITAEDQFNYDRRLPHFLKIPAVSRFLSVEPMCGKLELGSTLINQVIVGGESGDHWRDNILNLDYMRALFDQCRNLGIKRFAKQDSARLPGQRGRIPDDLWVQEFPV